MAHEGEAAEDVEKPAKGDHTFNIIIVVVGVVVAIGLMIANGCGRRSSSADGQVTKLPAKIETLEDLDLLREQREVEKDIAQTEREIREAKGVVQTGGRWGKVTYLDDSTACQAQPAVYSPTLQAERVIRLSYEGQRSIALDLTTTSWSAPVQVPTNRPGGRSSFAVVPHVGFTARVWDDLCGDLPYRDVTVLAGGKLHVQGLRKIQFRGGQDGQQMAVTVSD